VLLILLQIASIASVFFATYLVFQSLGLRSDRLFYSREEKTAFDKLISGLFGSYAAVSNIVATLTSLATVYVFFLGTTKIFGYYVFACAIAIGFSYWVTNRITAHILNSVSRVSTLDQVSSVIASVVWSDTPDGKRSAAIIKLLSLASIGSVVWLEFSIFADLSGALLGIESIFVRSGITFLIAFAIIFFTFRFGLRGFVFADVFQAPLIVIGSIGVLVGAIIAFATSGSTFTTETLRHVVQPIVSPYDGLMFVAHVLFLNSFFVIVSESHWLRVWVFRNQIIRSQKSGMITTALLWLLLIAIGLLGRDLTGHVGNEGVVDLLTKIYETTNNPLFYSAFWIAAVAALFSTADAQIYSFLVVSRFDSTTGTISELATRPKNELVISIVASFAMASIFYLVRVYSIPFEKLIFIIIPLNLNFVPAFIAIMFGKAPSPRFILASLLAYILCSAVGLFQPENIFVWTLAAALMPATMSAFLLCKLTIAKRSMVSNNGN
jgi:hypothetical protein